MNCMSRTGIETETSTSMSILRISHYISPFVFIYQMLLNVW